MKKLILILFLCPILMGAQSKNEHDITGVWRVIASSWDGNTKQYADCEIIKFITNTRWATMMYRPDTGKFEGAGGGTYMWKEGKYVETCEYFSWDPTAVGTQQEFAMNVQNDRLVQEGHLNTEKFKYPYYAVHERLDDLNWVYEGQASPQGVWGLTRATYGKDNYGPENIKERYGSVIKIITPRFFLGTFFDKGKRELDGVTFGTYKINKEGQYQETVKCWSWEDQSMVETRPAFDWAITDKDTYQQKGYLNSEKYTRYLIEEQYGRLEALDYRTKLWTTADQTLLLKELKRTKEGMVAATEALTTEQWHFKPDENTWNIGQVVEHMGIYERLYYFESNATLFNTDPRPEWAYKTKDDATYLAWMAEEEKHSAPVQSVPSGFMKGRDNLDYFLYGRDLLEAMVRSTDKDLKAHFVPRRSEPHGFQSIHGLLVVHFGHTDRHLRQIERIKAHPDYPSGK